MKNTKSKTIKATAYAFVFFTLNSQVSTAFAQGLLTPPGAPAPTMKTLDQIEPRTPIDAAHTPGDANNQFLIISPGSYYLTGNLSGVSAKNGIRINSDAVTIDLGGFEVNGTGAGASASGIVMLGTPRNGVTIRNGIVRNWGQSGLDIAFASNSHVENVTALGNGASGIAVGQNSTVRNCRAESNTATGIAAASVSTVEGCVAEATNGANGVGIIVGTGCVVSNCSASFNLGSNGGGIFTGQNCAVRGCAATGNNGASGIGIKLGDYSSATNCAAGSNNGTVGIGISANNSGMVSGCNVSNNTGDGIKAVASCTILSNQASKNGGAGVHTTGQSNRIDGNNVFQNSNHGILVDSTISLIVRNTASANTGGNYSIAASNGNAQVVTAGTLFTNTDPTANLSY